MTLTSTYLFTEVKGKAVCSVCGEQVAVLMYYNLNQLYGTKQANKPKNLTDAEWARAADGLPVKLQTLMITCQLSFTYLPQTFNQISMQLFKPKTDWIFLTE